MRCRSGSTTVTVLGLLAAGIATPAWGLEVVRTTTVAGGGPISVDIGGQLFLRFEGDKVPDADWGKAYELQRAQIALNVRWGTFMRLQIETDFGGGSVGLRDAFIELEPTRELELKVGRVKSPHGLLDITSRWNLVSLSRGLWNDILVDQLGFGDRQLSVLPKLRLRDLLLKPWVTFGVLGDLSTDAGADLAGAAGVKLSKALDVQASWHHRAGALVDGSHGNAVAVAAVYDRKWLYAMAEGTLGHARLLRRDGRVSTRDATFAAGRARVAVRIPLAEGVSLEPVIGGELLDPDVSAGSNLGYEILGGASLRWWDALRFGLEVDAQLGQDRFVVLDRTTLTAFLGANL